MTLTAIILTKNEELHIERCLSSLRSVCDEMLVVDSYSTDQTVRLAQQAGARVVQHAWTNPAAQFNYALTQCGVQSDWVWRVDADEYVEEALGKAVRDLIMHADSELTGLYVRRRIDFMGRPLRHGGWYPRYTLKVFRRGHGMCEQRWQDEHIRLTDGRTMRVSAGDQVDANLNGLTWWTEKHNRYATYEMLDLLMTELGMDCSKQQVQPRLMGSAEERKRWLKVKYARMPLFIRPFLNHWYRYFIRLGFLDGGTGFVWHILQGFWYRMLVDAKIFELKRANDWDRERIRQAVQQLTEQLEKSSVSRI
ncbi:MAG: glycosyltransferase family 2 protein [Paludibacteraceae bacterium]|nr:glycosyltransferase family 2 protein [Paludibacteraceae bacterium]